jgi:hypothetical protein
MKQLSVDHPRLKKAFREAFKENARQAAMERQPGQAFNYAVMREVRRIADAGARRNRFDWIPKTAWRLAPVACGVIFALTIFLMQYDPTFEYDMAAISLADPIGFHETNLVEF